MSIANKTPISQVVGVGTPDNGNRLLINSDGSINTTPAATGGAFSIGGATATLAVTTVTGNVSLAAIGSHLQIMVSAPSGNGAIGFIKFGTSNAVTAAVTDTPILPGTVQVYTVPSGTTYVAAITVSSTATLYFTPGDGQ